MQTQRYVAQPTGAKLIVLEGDRIRVLQLDIRQLWVVGRLDPTVTVEPDVCFTSRLVSRKHGWLHNIEGKWYFEDNPKNLNGTFYNGVKIPRPVGEKKSSVPLQNGDILRIDNEDLSNANENGVLMMFTTDKTKGDWITHPLPEGETLIGRDESCDIVFPLPYLSARHAKITRRGEKFYLSDCGSKSGTYLNSRLIRVPQALLQEKDHIALCDCNLFFLGDRLLYCRRDPEREIEELTGIAPAQRPVILKADIRSKTVRKRGGFGMKELVRDVQLEIRQGTLVALLGTAGAGKSTVMNCLNGMDLQGVQGTVLYRNVDLMKDLGRMKHLIGNVPQDKVFHPELTPEKEFWDAAKLRLPADMTNREIRERVDKTLKMLGIDNVRNNTNSMLSGGEKTRVNVGIELVADRDILFLDEPDQGLSPNYKEELFLILRSLAHEHGKSILSIIHDVSKIELFDQVIMLAKVDGVGRLAFSGTPEAAQKHFGVPIADAYALLEKEPERFVR